MTSSGVGCDSERQDRAARPINAAAALIGLAALSCRSESQPTPEEVIAWKKDLWGEAALHQPGGPSYEYFAKLVPPLRYVDAAYLHYPMILSAPGASVKARLISNGSSINSLARKPTWRNETGLPVRFLAGDQREVFGQDLT